MAAEKRQVLSGERCRQTSVCVEFVRNAACRICCADVVYMFLDTAKGFLQEAPLQELCCGLAREKHLCYLDVCCILAAPWCASAALALLLIYHQSKAC
jgi:hypothetical protein